MTTVTVPYGRVSANEARADVDGRTICGATSRTASRPEADTEKRGSIYEDSHR
jgi:hypothetical protein